MSDGVVHNAVFTLCAVLILIGSAAVVWARNPVRATLLLVGAFLPTALLYVLMHAPFVGILQVLVYAGAIMVLFTFVVMMVNPGPKDGELKTPDAASVRTKLGIAALLAAGGAPLIALVRRAAAELAPSGAPAADFGELSSLSRLVFEDPTNNPLTVSFELISFLILVGIVAAINFARRSPGTSRGA